MTVMPIFSNTVHRSAARNSIPEWVVYAIITGPAAVYVLHAVLLMFPATRSFGTWLQLENRPIESLTFLFFLGGGLIGLISLKVLFRHKESKWPVLLFALFSISMIIVAMEEVAWGQTLFGFETPVSLRQMNVQKEFTIHNIEGIHGKTEFARIGIALLGILGMARFQGYATSTFIVPRILLPCLALVVLHSIPDIYTELKEVPPHVERFVRRLSETAELLIAFAAATYVYIVRSKAHQATKG